MSGVIVIVAYRPKPEKETELLKLVRNRVPTLRKEGLVTDREPIIMRARTGRSSKCQMEIAGAIEAAQKIQTSSLCGRSSSRSAIAFRSETLAEAEEMFPNFEPL